MKDMWNERYTAPGYVYGTEPNEFFRAHLAARAPGRILLPAEGEGRNAVYAASQGWQVDAFDYSTAGRDKAMALAEERGVAISYHVADLSNAHFPEGEFDAVGLFFVHLPAALRIDVHTRCIRALKPGGLLLLEAFHPEQLDLLSGGPKNPDLLYSVAMLRADFAALHLDIAETVRIELDEGPMHRGPAAVVRVAGIRGRS